MARLFRYMIIALLLAFIAASCDAGLFGKKFGLMKHKLLFKPKFGHGFIKPKFTGKKHFSFKKKKFFG